LVALLAPCRQSSKSTWTHRLKLYPLSDNHRTTPCFHDHLSCTFGHLPCSRGRCFRRRIHQRRPCKPCPSCSSRKLLLRSSRHQSCTRAQTVALSLSWSTLELLLWLVLALLPLSWPQYIGGICLEFSSSQACIFQRQPTLQSWCTPRSRRICRRTHRDQGCRKQPLGCRIRTSGK